jgi:HEAT-like repeat
MQLTIPQISADSSSPSVCNNASWAVGEIALQLGPQFHPFVQHLLPRLIAIIGSNEAPAPILENAAIAIGRIGWVCSDDVAPQLPVLAGPFILALKDVRDNEEKDSAFKGLCTLIGKNPTGLGSELTAFVIAAAKYSEPSQELAEMFLTVSFFISKPNLDSSWVQKRNKQLARIQIHITESVTGKASRTIRSLIGHR